MRAVILQPSYMPWRGYFDLIRQADVFVFFDDVQYDRRGWRNRNRIKSSRGSEWLTVPVNSKGFQTEHRPINTIPILYDQPWQQRHIAKMRESYRNAPYFDEFFPILTETFKKQHTLLADLDIDLTVALARALGLVTPFLRSSTLGAGGQKTDRLINVLKTIGASAYLSGPSARAYIEPEKFSDAGIELEYIEYSYPTYEQFFPPFDPSVSIFDLLFMTGPNAGDYLKTTLPLVTR